ncbi:DUF3667 domain-containing protein [Rhodanobacter sp. Col0626]|uniref:DUF3667 domain-containing protein n=1 Tax=Rhodanobacter sp. Col0626 TaxID=3415679 RepID=UPI003CED4604
MKPMISYEGLHCANCGAPMQGEFCHECGQSIHSVLKPAHHMVEETIETVLHIDGRIVHTLPPLLLKPGFLTMEYFAGRRVRYIAPFRLMFVICLLSFFVFHLAIDQVSSKIVDRGPTVTVTGETFKDADTPKEVRKALKNQLKTLPHIAAYGVLPRHQLELAAQNMQQQANKRLIELGAAPMPATSVAIPPTIDTDTDPNPVRIAWLPEVVNARLTRLGHQIHNNWRTFKDGDPAARNEAKQRMINGVFSTLPATMFVLIPVFAVLLKLFYVFRQRLYMEHLIVALHSHAFMFLSLLLITATGMLSTWLHPHAAWTGYALGWVQTLLMLWIPTYLLIMQKRVYHQGWPMTVLKFWCIGWCYFWLLMLALVIAGVLGIAH